MNKVVNALVVILLSGCSTPTPPEIKPILLSDIKAQTFTYSELKGQQGALWEKARHHIAATYGKSQPVLRVENELNGTLLGKGVIRWKLQEGASSVYCYSDYDIRFMARDNKARFQLKLLAGIPEISECSDWELPSKYGYEQILHEFKEMSDRLELSFKVGI